MFLTNKSWIQDSPASRPIPGTAKVGYSRKRPVPASTGTHATTASQRRCARQQSRSAPSLDVNAAPSPRSALRCPNFVPSWVRWISCHEQPVRFVTQLGRDDATREAPCSDRLMARLQRARLQAVPIAQSAPAVYMPWSDKPCKTDGMGCLNQPQAAAYRPSSPNGGRHPLSRRSLGRSVR